MSLQVHQGGADVAAQAAAWVVRLSGEDAGFEDFEAFDLWLREGPDRAQAYDGALAVWSAADEAAGAMALPDFRAAPPHRRPQRWIPLAGAAMAAAVAAAFLLPVMKPAEVYTTTAGQHRQVALADGSHVDLNAASRMEVRWSRARRNVTLSAGEAAFDVARDASRPFVIRSGERSVRVVGTEFDVKARGSVFSVAVRRGIVEVSGAPGAAPIRLLKGDAVSFDAKESAGRRRSVDPDDAFAWTSGRLVFRDAALAEVVSALNLEFGAPAITLSPDAGRLHFTGVLRLDERGAVLRRLTASMPLVARETASGIVLEMAKPPIT